MLKTGKVKSKTHEGNADKACAVQFSILCKRSPAQPGTANDSYSLTLLTATFFTASLVADVVARAAYACPFPYDNPT